MKARPILFSGPMVRALLAGTKTQTRRIVKGLDATGHTPCGRAHAADLVCPYGQPGDRLWVRETWASWGGREYLYQQIAENVRFKSDFPEWDPVPGGEWRPSIHMPRWASRLTLEITNIRVQRLHDITDADALAEGSPLPNSSPQNWYACLWEDINGRGSWAENPWVWAINFQRITPPAEVKHE